MKPLKVVLQFTLPDTFDETQEQTSTLVEEALDELRQKDPFRCLPFYASNGVKIE